MSRERHGFSLVETAIAAALLALVVAACLPLLRMGDASSAARDGVDGEKTSGDGALAIELLAERIASAPDRFQVDLESAGTIAISWPTDLLEPKDGPRLELPPSMREATVDTLLPQGGAGDDARGRWLVVRAGDMMALRRVTLPAERRERRWRRADRVRTGATQDDVTTSGDLSPRGMTLVETLVALAILTALVLAVTTWTASAARFAAVASALERDAAVAEGILALVADDLDSFDRPEKARGKADEPRVRSDAGALVVRTRSSLPGRSGATVRRYAFDSSTGTLRAVDAASTGRTASTWTVARGVERFEVTVAKDAPLERAARDRERWRVVVTVTVGSERRTLARIVE